MQFDVITLFPEMFAAITESGVTRRAFEQKKCELQFWNPRDFTTDRHRTVDDRPYGGGPGMVMMAKPLQMALHAARERQQTRGFRRPKVIYLSPQGNPLNHTRVMEWAGQDGLVLLCGRYEAVDQRLLDREVDEEISLGDFVLSGGELPAMALMDAVIRQYQVSYTMMRLLLRIVLSMDCSIVRITRGRRSLNINACPVS